MDLPLPVDDVTEMSEYDQLVKVIEDALDASFLADMAAAFAQRASGATAQDEAPAAASA